MIARQEIHQMMARLEATLDRAKPVTPIEVQADYAKYVCVLVSGLIEKAAYLCLLDCAQRTSSPRIQRYVESNLSWFQNAKASKLVELFAQFDSLWATQLEAFLVDEKKDAVDSIVTNRHRIAHGEQVGGLSIGRMKDYYKAVKAVIEEMLRICECP